MSDGSQNPEKPLVFISYSHTDQEWLNYVQSFLKPAIKQNAIEVWQDRELAGGDLWEKEIKLNLERCDVCILLISRHSTASGYILDKEVPIIEERRAKGEHVHFYPIILSPTPGIGLDRFKAFNLRPRDGKPLSSFKDQHDRDDVMAAIADELARLVTDIRVVKKKLNPAPDPTSARVIEIGRLPDTPNRALVGREAELAWLDEAWARPGTHVVSLIAEGGVGKSALVNEWLAQLQRHDYGGADAVIGWSFYSQGSRERTSSAEPFLDQAVDWLGQQPDSPNASAKAKAIAEAMTERRVLLVLDGLEPLQEPPGPQFGRLRDTGLRELLRRVAQQPACAVPGLIVITSRAPLTELDRFRDAAPGRNLENLSRQAGAALLRDVLMDEAPDGARPPPQKELETASEAFGGHALSLGLLGGYIRDVHNRDIRCRRDIQALTAYGDNPGQGHAIRVLQSYAAEWLADRPQLLAIMHLIGLFDRPADADCLQALRDEPAIPGLTDAIVGLSTMKWDGAVALLRRAKLLLEDGRDNPGGLDAHPLVREYFGTRLEQENPEAWREAHSRLYDHLTRTEEGDDPDQAALAPLFQAIPHGVRAGRVQEALDNVYRDRLCRRGTDGKIAFHAFNQLGAFGPMLSAVAWFFEAPYGRPAVALSPADQSWVLSVAAFGLRALGRVEEAIAPMQARLRSVVDDKGWRNAAVVANNLSQTQLAVGRVAEAVATARQAVDYADRSEDRFEMLVNLTILADALHQAGEIGEAQTRFEDAEAQQADLQPDMPRLYSLQGYKYCDLLLAKGNAAGAMNRADYAIDLAQRNRAPLSIGLDTVTLARAALHQAVSGAPEQADRARREAAAAIDRLREAGSMDHLPRGLLARAAAARYFGEWAEAERDLDEVLEIAEPGPMRLFMADAALERARLCFARIEGHAPFAATPPAPPDPEAAETLRTEAAAQIETARTLIDDCGYGRRRPELEELDAIQAGTRRYADLPPRV